MDKEKVLEAVQKEADMPKMTKKQQEKEEKKAKQYWGSMITRKEAYELVAEALQAEREKSRVMYIQLKTLTNLVVDKGLATMDELDELSKPVIEEIFGANPTAKSDAEKEKDEGTQE